jgi:hypothetical protein
VNCAETITGLSRAQWKIRWPLCLFLFGFLNFGSTGARR